MLVRTPHFRESESAFSQLSDGTEHRFSARSTSNIGSTNGAGHHANTDELPPLLEFGTPEMAGQLARLKTERFEDEELEDELEDEGAENYSAPIRLVSSRPNSPVRRQLRQTHPQFSAKQATKQPAINTSDLMPLALEWFDWTLSSGQSERTVELRRYLLDRLHWWLQHHGHHRCGEAELKKFFSYLIQAYKLPEGRWCYGDKFGGRKPLRPATLNTYYRHLASFFKHLADEEYLPASPMDGVPRIKLKVDQIEPFTTEQIKSLLRASTTFSYPRRDEAIVRLLLDTGIRATELCTIKIGDVDFFARRARVLGKGNKYRVVSWGKKCGMALRAYIREEYFSQDNYKPEYPLFLTGKGENAGEAMNRHSLRLLIRRLGQRAGIGFARCSPHTFRHTFAINFLRNGGSIAALQLILGHDDIKSTMIYVKYAQADIEQQQKQFSPGDALD